MRLGAFLNFFYYSQEKVGKMGRRDPQVRPGAFSPFVGQHLTADACDSHILQTTRDRIKAGRQGDDVKFVVGAIFLDNAI